ncbi:hypothetical protein H0H81_001627 [Sphagnurus paluster]|uniref:DnaJ homologue subfamily C member 28 conserved domain-containing protein n=1 Tax=Sphagnurus paluster TaxID=117069 RepID=A0A9P7GHR4_9AGAR|nr:hypothetical protein H0H81_001627 [Sphagnurus paluster]
MELRHSRRLAATIYHLHHSNTHLSISLIPHRNASSSASDKLFADAVLEESNSSESSKKSSRLTVLENEHENWDGEERMQDAVLRMLIDKYKPLRTGTIQSAEQKLKLTPPRVRPLSQVIVTPTTPMTGSWATEPLLPSKKDHQPWHTTFKASVHETSSIKHALLPPLPAQPQAKPSPIDDRARRKQKEERKRNEHAGRLVNAREATLDYRLGIRGAGGAGGQANPVSLKGWTSLVEDKIEKARKAGMFESVKGRGKPLVPVAEESNPFIAREEFLMNRIVQRNGAAPPWVEVQGELDNALNTFREILRQSWIRRVVRVITTATPPALLYTFTLRDVKRFRDPEWEQHERSYHQAAMKDLNALARKYNGLAPYAVRRPYYVLNVEMERLYDGCAEEIKRQLETRVKGPSYDEDLSPLTTSSGITANDGEAMVAQPWQFSGFLRHLLAILAQLWSRRRRIEF